MKHIINLASRRRQIIHTFMLGVMITCMLWMILPTPAQAKTGVISDDARVLNTNTIANEASQLSYTVDVLTTNQFAGTTTEFDADVKTLVSNSYTNQIEGYCDPRHHVGCVLYQESQYQSSSSHDTILYRKSGARESIEIGIDTKSRHVAIYSGNSVHIQSDRYRKAVSAFQATIKESHDDYTKAVIAALQTLENGWDRFGQGVSKVWPFVPITAIIAFSLIYHYIRRNDDDYNPSYHRYHHHHSSSYSSSSSDSSSSSSDSGGGGGASGDF